MPIPVADVLRDYASHDFANHSGYDGVGDCEDQLWRHQLVAHRDLARSGPDAIAGCLAALDHPSPYVRNLAIKFLGLHRCEDAIAPLGRILLQAEDVPGHGCLLSCEAAIALGRIGTAAARQALMGYENPGQPHSDVANRVKVALQLLDRGEADGEDIIAAYAAIDASGFRSAVIGQPAPAFSLTDHALVKQTLSEYRGKTVVLIWIFAEWCPVCHGEFHDLIAAREEFSRLDVHVFTVQVADLPRTRLMSSMHQHWWPHLCDPCGETAARYGVDPFEFTVHAEWINRPATVIIDRQGILRSVYAGTFFGDRPSIPQVIDMVRTENYAFTHAKRRPQHPS